MSLALSVLFGAGIGLGIFVVARSLQRRPVPLAETIGVLHRPGVSVAAVGRPVDPEATGAWRRRLGTIGVGLLEALGFVDVGVLRGQLRVLDKTLERHAYEKTVGAVAGFLIPALAGVVINLAGAAVSPVVVLAAAVLCGAAGFFYPDLPLRQAVERRRQSFRHALSSYLDLVTIILAGGGGIESALWGAADAGDGWAFTEIRQALRRARRTRHSPWQAFDQLGAALGVDELRQIAASVSLAGGHGARVRQSLAAKADALRAAQAAQIEADAEARTEKMIVPVIVMVVGLVLFIGYGAVEAITSDGASQFSATLTPPQLRDATESTQPTPPTAITTHHD